MGGEYDQRIAKIEENVGTTMQIVKNIEMALIGNKPLGIDGVVPKLEKHEQILFKLCEKDVVNRLDEHEKYIEADKKRKWMIHGSVATISGIISALTMWLSIRGKV
jgi:hypothetical protein